MNLQTTKPKQHMNTGIDTEMVQERYRRMTDNELIRIATQDAFGLTPEAMEVVKTEIRKRNLQMGEEIIRGVEAQNREYTEEEIAVYCDIICNLPCPSCGSADEPLNATITAEVMSFVFFTQYKKSLKVGCPTCLDKANNAALTKTAIMGWWGIPWGIIKTLQALDRNWKSKQTNHVAYHNGHLFNFILANIGSIETYKEDEESLQQLLVQNNSE
jgi:hypothetical protein